MFEGRKVLWVAGGRGYTNRAHIKDTLYETALRYGYEVLITGAANGADLIAQDVWRQFQMPYVGIPAQWAQFSKGAGPIRNRAIASMEPDGLLTFPGGSGTADAREAANEYGIALVEGTQVGEEPK